MKSENPPTKISGKPGHFGRLPGFCKPYTTHTQRPHTLECFPNVLNTSTESGDLGLNARVRQSTAPLKRFQTFRYRTCCWPASNHCLPSLGLCLFLSILWVLWFLIEMFSWNSPDGENHSCSESKAIVDILFSLPEFLKFFPFRKSAVPGSPLCHYYHYHCKKCDTYTAKMLTYSLLMLYLESL